MPEWTSITPMLPTGPQSMDESIAFFTQQMGFTCAWRGQNMAGLRHGQVSILLVENNNRDWAENSSYSIGVSDLEQLYVNYSLASARVGPLEMKSWGRREFHMILPSGVCLQFFQS